MTIALNPDAAEEQISHEQDIADLLTDLVHHLLAEDPETSGAAHVAYIQGERAVSYLIRVKNNSHRAIVIGTRGRTIMALRRIVRALGGAVHKHYALDLAEDKGKE